MEIYVCYESPYYTTHTQQSTHTHSSIFYLFTTIDSYKISHMTMSRENSLSDLGRGNMNGK